jgi:predicted heme/steroid binding protein
VHTIDRSLYPFSHAPIWGFGKDQGGGTSGCDLGGMLFGGEKTFTSLALQGSTSMFDIQRRDTDGSCAKVA